jgi:hypothetical protein
MATAPARRVASLRWLDTKRCSSLAVGARPVTSLAKARKKKPEPGHVVKIAALKKYLFSFFQMALGSKCATKREIYVS